MSESLTKIEENNYNSISPVKGVLLWGGGILVVLLGILFLVLFLSGNNIKDMKEANLANLLTVIGGMFVGYMMLTTAVISNITARQVGWMAIKETQSTGHQARETAVANAKLKQAEFYRQHRWDIAYETFERLIANIVYYERMQKRCGEEISRLAKTKLDKPDEFKWGVMLGDFRLELGTPVGGRINHEEAQKILGNMSANLAISIKEQVDEQPIDA